MEISSPKNKTFHEVTLRSQKNTSSGNITF